MDQALGELERSGADGQALDDALFDLVMDGEEPMHVIMHNLIHARDNGAAPTLFSRIAQRPKAMVSGTNVSFQNFLKIFPPPPIIAQFEAKLTDDVKRNTGQTNQAFFYMLVTNYLRNAKENARARSASNIIIIASTVSAEKTRRGILHGPDYKTVVTLLHEGSGPLLRMYVRRVQHGMVDIRKDGFESLLENVARVSALNSEGLDPAFILGLGGRHPLSTSAFYSRYPFELIPVSYTHLTLPTICSE